LIQWPWGWLAIFPGFSQLFLSEFIIIIIAVLPVFELRGAIVVAMALDMPPGKAWLLAVLGSLLPAIPILLYLPPLAAYLRKTLLRPMINWALQRGLQQSEGIRQCQWWGLLIFVALPFPSTGVWTGSVIASLLGLNLREALPPIFIGTMIAGLIVITLVYGIPWSFL
jgi:uncharacterized membrane protein